VIVTSDHGESLGQHGLDTHGRALYWELLRVPLVIWFPGHVPAGLRVSRPVTNAAIPATIMDIVDGSASSSFPGPVLSNAWKSRGSESAWPTPLAELARNPYPEDMEKIADQTEPTSTTGAMKSLVTPQRHWIAHEIFGNQLYAISQDAGEKSNLIYADHGRAELSELRHSLAALLQAPWPEGRDQRMKSGIVIASGSFDSPSDKEAANDYYRLQVTPGSSLKIEVQTSNMKPSSKLDPVLSIEDEQGEPLQTCRTPGDDHLKRPGIPDPTPTAFDDLCVSDDVAVGTDPSSRLELYVDAPRELFVHVADWNQTVKGRKNYRLVVSSGQSQ
jgi:hypothetical protein